MNQVINIAKNETLIDLGKKHNLRRIQVGLGWDENTLGFGGDFDLDAVLFMLGQDGKLKQTFDLIFYNNRIRLKENKPFDGADWMIDEVSKKNDYAVYHTGDNRTGEGDGDDEQINIEFSKIPDYIHKMVVAITIHDEGNYGTNFGMVDNAYARIVDLETDQEKVHYKLNEKYADATAVIVGTFVKKGYDWDFVANSEGLKGGLGGLVQKFGMGVKK